MWLLTLLVKINSSKNFHIYSILYRLCFRDDDDINDVATMGGVNLSEESRNILATNADFIGTQIRSCKDESFLFHNPLLSRITAIGKSEDCSYRIAQLKQGTKILLVRS